MNVLGIWIDCNFNPFVDTWNASDADFKEVEEWIQNRIKGNSPIQQEVVKTYD